MHPDLAATAHAQGDVFTRAQALACGYSPAAVRQLVDGGTWRRMRRGVLALDTAAAANAGNARATHLHDAAAVLVAMRIDAYLSHRSAALAWDLPVLGRTPADVSITVERQHRRKSDGVELHTARTPEHHRGIAERLPVTSAARTVSDLSRQLAFTDAVVAADAALHRRLCSPSDLERVVHDCWVWPGIARTKLVLGFADGRSESPGESLSRVAIAAAGLPAPELQTELVLDSQPLRVDFMWPAQRLIGEFDGRVKYGAAEDLWREKQREDRIRRHGYRVVRWIWPELFPRPEVAIARIRQALAEG